MGKIYIADDEKNIRELLVSFLEQEHEVESFETGDQLFLRFLEAQADVVVLDVMMPGTDGFGTAKRLRERSNVPIILLTARDSDQDFIEGFATGADDYFTKPFSPVKLALRIKAILQRQQVKAVDRSEQLSLGELTLDVGQRTAFIKNQALKLTNTEFSLLQVLLRAEGAAVSRDELLSQIWGYESEVETQVTDDTVKRLRKKLRQEAADVVIETVWGFGFRLVSKEVD